MSVPQVLGRYQLKAKLAVGGQSEVWFALRRGPGGFQRRCAVKLLLPPLSYDDQARKAFIAEARLAALFDHSNLTPVTDLGEDEKSGVVFAVMPYISGISLAYVTRNRHFEGMGISESLWLTSRILLALDFAHNLRDRGRKLNIIHRDISPENVLVGFDGEVRVIDFGIALSAINPRNTRIHVVKGKLDFLSPEQANASNRLDQTTDIYSAGLLLYSLLTGTNPLDGDVEGALDRARNPTIPRLDSLLAVPTDLKRLVHAMLSPIPSERPQAAGNVARQLLAIMHRVDPGYDELSFGDSVRQRLAKKIEEENRFLQGLGEGTQIIRTGELEAVPRDDPRNRRGSTPIVSTDDLVKPRVRDTGLEATRDDLQAILAEIEDIYEE